MFVLFSYRTIGSCKGLLQFPVLKFYPRSNFKDLKSISVTITVSNRITILTEHYVTFIIIQTLLL